MLGRKDFTREELDAATRNVAGQLAAYRALVAAVDTSDPEVKAALEDLEPRLFANLTLALDRRFVHRLRGVTGKDGNPLNEVELIVEALMGDDGELRPISPIRYQPEEAVLGIEPGERIVIDADRFERLSTAFLATLEEKYV